MGRVTFAVDQDRALWALRARLGHLFDIGRADGRWWAVRLAAGGEPLDADTPDELAAAMEADWASWSAGVAAEAAR